MLTIEEYIYQLYKTMDIRDPSELKFDSLADLLGVEVTYSSNSFSFDNEILLERGTESYEWTSFGHELCHYLRHAGNQMNMHELFVDLQEFQADYFAYHFCIPTFLLNEMELPNCLNAARSIVAGEFNVEPSFAEKRLEMWKESNLSKMVI